MPARQVGVQVSIFRVRGEKTVALVCPPEGGIEILVALRSKWNLSTELSMKQAHLDFSTKETDKEKGVQWKNYLQKIGLSQYSLGQEGLEIRL